MAMGNSHSDASDEALMRRYQRRLDEGAFETLVARFSGPALTVAEGILCDRGLAEDAVQETFLRLVRSRRRYRPSRPFATWFYTILRNVCTDMLRRRGRRERALRRLASEPREQEEVGAGLEARDLLGLLMPADRVVLTLRVLHGLAFRDVAVALGISEEAAKKRAQRALRRLRRLVQPEVAAAGARQEAMSPRGTAERIA